MEHLHLGNNGMQNFTILQVVLLISLTTDSLASWYAYKKNIHIDDSYYKFQKSYGIKTFTILKIIAGTLYLYFLPQPTGSRYGDIIAVPCYSFFVLLLCYHLALALKTK